MLLFSKTKAFIQENLVVLCILLFFTVLGYGYFITHWAVDSDSVEGTFTSYSYLWVSHGRPADALYNYLSLEQVLPFFNDFISVCFIFITGVLWLIIIENCGIKLSKKLAIVFACICIICPMYSFFLRFTVQNIFTEFSLFICALSAYHFSSFLNERKLFNFISSITLCALSLMSYQTYASYFITAVVFIVLLRMLNNYSIKSKMMELLYGAFILVIATIIYKLVCSITFYIVPESSYTEQFIAWGRQPFFAILSGWKTYFSSLLAMNFNFLMLLTVYIALPCLIVINFFKKKSFTIVVLLLFIMSPFALVFALGNGMPLRTLQAVPLMLAGVWFLLYQSCNGKVLKRIIVTIIIISTLFNAQHINRLFYSDVMRLEYDKNFANRIYNHILDKTGDAIESKPLVITGTHFHKPKPFIVHYDSIGPSFFDTNAENSTRLNKFMSWLGDDYIMPTEEQIKEANIISEHMSSYPNKGNVKETKDFVILKLSDKVIVNPTPVSINLKNYTTLNQTNLRSSINPINQENNTLSINGWAYIKNKNAENTKTYIKITNGKSYKLYPVNILQKPDVAKLQNDATNIQDSGWSISFTKNPLKANSKVDLVLINGTDIVETRITLPKKIKPIKLDLNGYKKLPYTLQRSYVSTFSFNNDILSIDGWAYMKNTDAQNTHVYIGFYGSNHNYIYKTNKIVIDDIKKSSMNVLNIENSGYSYSNKYNLPKDNYKVSLIIVNDKKYTVADTGHTVNMCGKFSYKCWF